VTDAPPSTSPQSFDSPSRISGITGIAALILFTLIAAYPGAIAGHVRSFQLAYLIGMAGYAMLIRCIWKSPPPASLTGWCVLALAIRLPLLTMSSSDDVYRYLWEGRVQLHGVNPYSLAPDDPTLAPLRDENWSNVNHPNWPAIYPPLAQLEFAILAAIHPDLRLFKATHALWDFLTFLLLMAWLRDRGLDPRRAIVYGLCPLTLTAFSISGHVDALMLLLMVAACRLFDQGRVRWAGVSLGLAVAAKIMALPLLLWFAYRNLRSALIAIATILLCYLPYLAATTDLFHSLLRFGAEQEFYSLIHYPLGRLLFIPLPVSKAILLAAWLAFTLWRLRRTEQLDQNPTTSRGIQPARPHNGKEISPGQHRVGAPSPTAQFAAPVFAALLLALPVLHYWYLAWLLVFLPFRLRISWLILAATMLLYFDAQHQLDQTGDWFLPVWARWATILAFAVAALAEYANPLWPGTVVPSAPIKR
jgi:hypothetical protein